MSMLNDIYNGFSKFASPQRVFILIIFLVLAWFLMNYSGNKGLIMDGMETGNTQSVDHTQSTAASPEAPPAGYDNKPTVNPTDLLPSDANSQWAALNPSTMSAGNVLNGDLLATGYHYGIDSIGASMKNANLQLRADPIIAKQDVGPWNQSTFEPDYSRKPLE
jgi:hypothetical protein